LLHVDSDRCVGDEYTHTIIPPLRCLASGLCPIPPIVLLLRCFTPSSPPYYSYTRGRAECLDSR
jgi:hypothetical protein